MQTTIIRFLLAGMAILLHSLGYAQISYDVTNIIPPSPNAASLGVYGDVPVSLYTGTPQISVPIYTVKSGDISVDIKLDYLSGGIKVAQDASWVGLGWSLQAGGVITRTVRGIDDFDLAGGFYNHGDLPPCNENNDMDVTGPDDPMIANWWYDFKSIYEGYQDSEPDIFYYNFNGNSGKFTINNGNEGGDFLMAARNDLLIEFIPTSPNGWTTKGYWLITDGSGYQYKFNVEEVSLTHGSSGSYNGTQLELFNTGIENNGLSSAGRLPTTTAWYLSSIISPTGEMVTFEYEKKSYSLSLTSKSYERLAVTQVSDPPFSNADGPPSGYHSPNLPSSYHNFTASRQLIADVYLKKIFFKGGHLEFNTSDRGDIEEYTGNTVIGQGQSGPPQKLQNVILYDDNDFPRKRFNFHYTYFNSGSSNYFDRRLKLDSLTLADGSDQRQGSYEFTYFQQTSLPGKYSHAIDHWGYHNNAPDNQLIIPSLITVNNIDGSPGFLNGGDRNPSANLNDVQSWTLTSIKYPTGGKTVFEYELNDFVHESSTPSNIYGEVTRQAQAVHYPPSHIQHTKSFTLTQPFTLVTYAFEVAGGPVPGDPVEGPNPVLAYITHNGEIVPGTLLYYNSLPSYTTVLPQGEYTLTLKEDRIAGYTGIVMLTATWKEQASSQGGGSNTKIGGGLRIRKISHYGDDANPIIKKYTYTKGGESSGKLIPEIFYFWQSQGAESYGAAYQWGFNIVRARSSAIRPLGFSSQGITFGYSRVTEWLGENGEGGRTEYYYVNKRDSVYNHAGTDLQLHPYIPNRSFSENGQLVKSLIFDKAGKKVKSREYTYKRMERYVSKAVMLEPVPPGFYNFFTSQPSNGQIPLWYPNKVKYYDNTSDWWIQSRVKEKTFSGTDSLTIVKKYAYENPAHRQLTREQTDLSDGSVRISKRKYVLDYENYTGHPIMNSMAERHLTASVVEQHDLIKRGSDVKLLAGTLVEYGIENNVVVPKVTYSIETVIPLPDTTESSIIGETIQKHSSYKPKIYFDSYGANGKLLQYHKEGEANHSLTWGYNNSFPIAQTLNAESGSVFYTSFEEDNENGEIVLNSNDGSIYAVTGSKVKATPYTLPMTFPPGTKMSYWFTSGVGTDWQFSGEVPLSQTISQGIYIDEVRVYPSNARMSTYTYDPLVGLTGMRDENNKSTFYEYDNFSRLKFVLNDDKDITKVIDYHYANSISPNYVREATLQRPSIRTDTQVSNLAIADKRVSSVYFDGLGRPVQTVEMQGSPKKWDLVQPVQYDEFGREAVKFLPFVANEDAGNYNQGAVDIGDYTNSQHFDFYNNGPADKVSDDAHPFSRTVFDSSPLNRVLVQGSPGTPWQPFVAPKDYSESWTYHGFLANPVLGGGGVQFKVENEVLSVTFNGGFDSTPLLTGAVKAIQTNVPLPDIELGLIAAGNYRVSIRNNFLFITSVHQVPAAVANFGNVTLQAVLNPYKLTLRWDFHDFLANPVNGGGTETEVKIKDELLTVRFSAGFQPTPLKTGYVKPIPSIPPLPDMQLGLIASGNYYVSIKDSYLYIEPYPFGSSATPVTNFGGITFQVSLIQGDSYKVLRREYLLNKREEVILFRYDESTKNIDLPGGLTYYDANQLYANKTYDEHNNEVIEYVDKEGRTVLKRVQYDEQGGTKLYAETYYIYDDFGNLVMVLPPEGVKELIAIVGHN